MDRWGTPHNRVNSPTWGRPPPCKKALRTHPHESGYSCNWILLYKNRPSVHTKPVNPLTGTALQIGLKPCPHNQICGFKDKIRGYKVWTGPNFCHVTNFAILAAVPSATNLFLWLAKPLWHRDCKSQVRLIAILLPVKSPKNLLQTRLRRGLMFICISDLDKWIPRETKVDRR